MSASYLNPRKLLDSKWTAVNPRNKEKHFLVTGIVDPETQSAIEKFERERKLPVTGQLSHRVVRELAAITGRPLE